MAKGVIIGIAGPSASGKTVVARHIAKRKSAYWTKYSDVLLRLARNRKLSTNKASLQALSTQLRHDHGEDFLTRELHRQLVLVPNKMVVVEGNRRMVDMHFLTSLAEEEGKELVLIYIDADPSVRFGRMLERLAREGQEPITRSMFDVLENDECEEELPLVRDYVKAHGTVIDNTDLTLETLTKEVDELLIVTV